MLERPRPGAVDFTVGPVERESRTPPAAVARSSSGRPTRIARPTAAGTRRSRRSCARRPPRAQHRRAQRESSVVRRDALRWAHGCGPGVDVRPLSWALNDRRRWAGVGAAGRRFRAGQLRWENTGAFRRSVQLGAKSPMRQTRFSVALFRHLRAIGSRPAAAPRAHSARWRLKLLIRHPRPTKLASRRKIPGSEDATPVATMSERTVC